MNIQNFWRLLNCVSLIKYILAYNCNQSSVIQLKKQSWFNLSLTLPVVFVLHG